MLVGPNDVGKSSLLRCLDLLLGASTAQLYSWLVVEDLQDANQPLIIEADLEDFDADQEALFPDEITVDAGTGKKSLTIKLAATFDSNQTLNVERTAPDGGTARQLSREQISGFGWQMLGATGLSRDLRADRKSHLDDILQAVDLGADRATFDALATQFEDALTNSTTLDDLRTNLAGQLSRALPEAVAKDDLAFVPGSSAENDVLSDVRLRSPRVVSVGVSPSSPMALGPCSPLPSMTWSASVRTWSRSTSRRFISTRRASAAWRACCSRAAIRNSSPPIPRTSSAPSGLRASSPSEAVAASYSPRPTFSAMTSA